MTAAAPLDLDPHAAFKAYAKDHAPWLRDLSRYDGEPYHHPETRKAFSAFEAGRASVAGAVATEHAPLEDLMRLVDLHAKQVAEGAFGGNPERSREVLRRALMAVLVSRASAPVAGEESGAERAADPCEQEREAFYDAYDSHTRNTGHKPTPFDVWLMARGLMDANGKRTGRAALAAAPAPEPPRAPRLIGWRSDDYLHETADPKVAKNWEPHMRLLPIFEGDTNTKLAQPHAQAASRAPAAPVTEAVAVEAGGLPPLPDASFTYERHPSGFAEPERIGAYTADQMQAYARVAVAQMHTAYSQQQFSDATAELATIRASGAGGDAEDAARYRRLRENWIDCDELGLHGRLAVIDSVVDAARARAEKGPAC